MPISTPGLTQKFIHRWVGPFTVVSRDGHVNYVVKLVHGSSKNSKFHVEHLKRYIPRETADFQPTEEDLDASQQEFASQCRHTVDIQQAPPPEHVSDGLTRMPDPEETRRSSSISIETTRTSKIAKNPSRTPEEPQETSKNLQRPRRAHRSPERYILPTVLPSRSCHGSGNINRYLASLHHDPAGSAT